MAGPLLGGRLRPLTDVIGFVEAPPHRCADAFARVVSRRLGTADPLRRRAVPGDLERALRELLPVRDGPTGDRFLLVPTDGPWTAYFENGVAGGDPRPAAEELPQSLGCRTATVYAVQAGEGDRGAGLAIAGFTLAAPGRAGPSDAVRVLVVQRGDGRDVQTYGEPLPGEPEPDRLDADGLDTVLRTLGIRAFDPGFYLPPGTDALLLSASPGAGRS